MYDRKTNFYLLRCVRICRGVRGTKTDSTDKQLSVNRIQNSRNTLRQTLKRRIERYQYNHIIDVTHDE